MRGMTIPSCEVQLMSSGFLPHPPPRPTCSTITPTLNLRSSLRILASAIPLAYPLPTREMPFSATPVIRPSTTTIIKVSIGLIYPPTTMRHQQSRQFR